MLPAPYGDPIDPNEPILEPPPQYPQAQYPPGAYNQYGQPTYGAPAAPYYDQYGYNSYGPTRSDRPGQALGAAVIAMVSSALLLISGFFVIFAASTLTSDSDFETGDRTTGFVLAGLGNVIAASLLIVGAVLMLGRSRGARLGIVLGALLCLALGAFWFNEQDGGGGAVFWLVVFCGPALVAGLLTLSSRVTAWLNTVDGG